MARSYRHIKQYEKEMLELKAQGVSVKAIGEKFESDISKHYFDTDMLIKLLDEHREGKFDNSRKIWTVFSFLIWYDVYFNDKWEL